LIEEEKQPIISEAQFLWASVGMVVAIFLAIGSGDLRLATVAIFMTSALKMGEYQVLGRKSAAFYSFAYLLVGASYLFVGHL
jgi:hypothetical protein